MGCLAMKKRITALFTITVAAVLCSSIAYAAKKKLQTKSEPKPQDISEADLAAGLTDVKGGQKQQRTVVLPDVIQKEDEKAKELMLATMNGQ